MRRLPEENLKALLNGAAIYGHKSPPHGLQIAYTDGSVLMVEDQDDPPKTSPVDKRPKARVSEAITLNVVIYS